MVAKYPSSFVVVLLLGFLVTACGSLDSDTEPSGGAQPVATTTSEHTDARQAPTDDTAPTTEITTVAPDLTDCTSTLASTYQQIETVEELAWMSHFIVIGEVVDRLPPTWGDAPNPLEPSRRLIYTSSLVQVTDLLRGQPTATVLVQQLGGKIDGCVQTHESEELLEVGDELVLFLRETESITPGAAGTYYLTGGDQGLWTISRDGTVNTSVGHLQAYDGVPLSELTNLIQAALAGAPPESPLAPEYFVSITEAPIPTMEAVQE